MLVATKRQPTSRQPSVSTQINNCLTVEFNPIPRFVFYFSSSIARRQPPRKPVHASRRLPCPSGPCIFPKRYAFSFRRQPQKYGAVFYRQFILRHQVCFKFYSGSRPSGRNSSTQAIYRCRHNRISRADRSTRSPPRNSSLLPILPVTAPPVPPNPASASTFAVSSELSP